MKYLLTISLALLLFNVPAANAATFTASHSGDWNTPATWGLSGTPTCGTNIPCMTSASLPGDTVVINAGIAVTCIAPNEVCSVGNSPATNANVLNVSSTAGTSSLEIGSTATFVYAGQATLTSGTVRLDAGSKIIYDSSWSSSPSTVAYSFEMSTGNTLPTHPALWSIAGANGNEVLWEGDAFYSPLRQPSACTSAGSCKSGNIGNGTSLNNINNGAISYLTVRDVGGSWFIRVHDANTNIDHLHFVNSGSLFFTSVGGQTANGTVDRSSFLNCPTSCFQIASFAGATTGINLFSNIIVDGKTVALPATGFNIPFVNVMFYKDAATGGILGVGPIGGVDASPWDQVLIYNNAWDTTTGSDSSNSNRPYIPQQNTTNSVFFEARSINGGHHTLSFQGRYSNAKTGGVTQHFNNNVIGSMNVVGAGDGAAYTLGGDPGTANTPIDVSGNVYLCGANGGGSTSMMFFSNTTMQNVNITLANNTACNNMVQGFTSGNFANGGVGAESITIAAHSVTSINSNFWFNAMPGGSTICELCDIASPAYVATPWIDLITSNAVMNTNSSAVPPIGSNNSGANAWYVTYASTDMIQQNHIPVTVETMRSLPLFDSEYLQVAVDNSGNVLLPLSNYTSDPQWRGSWTAATAYNPGDVVSDSQSGAFGGKTTYWRCLAAHVANATTNRPVTGFNSALPFKGQEAWWEPAYFNWFRSTILAGTQYSDGAIGANNVYAIGLLNAWLRQGMTSMEPTLWNGCLNGKECGAIQLTAIQHVPPPAAVN